MELLYSLENHIPKDIFPANSTTSASSVQIFNNPEFGDVRVVMQDGEPWFVGKDVADVTNTPTATSSSPTSASSVQIFNNPEFGDVRVVMQDGEPWFVGKDVADKLGYAQTSNMMKRIDTEDFMSSILDGMNMKSILINESGLYSAIIGSKLPSAKKFKRWVTSEVLPDFMSSILDGMNMKSILINESGLYSAIIGSKLPSAKKFKRWVTSEVLPAIRKTGGYVDQSRNRIKIIRDYEEKFKAPVS